MLRETNLHGMYAAVRMLLITLFFVGIPLTLIHAQFSLGAQVRPRAEFRNGFKTLTVDQRDPAFFIEQRSRLVTDYNTTKYQVHIALQDVRIWGSTNQISKTDPNVLNNVYEAWGLYQHTPNWSFKFGRMALGYNNERFLGRLEWAAQGRSHDAMLITYLSDSTDLQIDIGAAFNQRGFEPALLFGTYYTGVNNYKTMQYLWLHKEFGGANFSFLFHNDGRQLQADSSLAMRQTIGLVGHTRIGGVKVGAEAFYQGGKNGADREVDAYMLAAFATVELDQTPITLGFDYLSGTSTEDDQDRSFIPLYGTNHKFYGLMDYFYVGNPHGQAGNIAGLLDVYAKMSIALSKRSSLALHGHAFRSGADIFDPVNTDEIRSAYLGTEVDLVLSVQLDPKVKLNVGYSQMWATESMELLKTTPGDHTALNNWAWFQINFNPTVFTATERKE